MFNVCVRVSSLEAMLTKGGISMFIFPSGPSISTLLSGSVRLIPRLCRFGGVSRIRNVTSGGSESGARPILELHFAVDEK